ncbi:MAG TPA: NUDIX hydrolase [Gammaproteobacteria bacterium]
MSEWRPHITVAAVIEREGRFLVVEEKVDGRVVINQPAGHVERGESLLEAVERETLEESGRHFVPEALVGVYSWTNPDTDITYVRFAFTGSCSERDPARSLDTGIIDARWMSREELLAQPERLRSPLVLRVINDYLAGRRFHLDLLHILHNEADIE